LPESELSDALSKFAAHARANPDRLAIVVAAPEASGTDQTLTFGELAARTASIQEGLRRAGFQPGDRVIALAPLSVDFYGLALALLASGMVIILVDGSMAPKRMLQVFKGVRARAIVSVRALLKWWPLVPTLARLRRYSVDRAGLGVRPFAELLAQQSAEWPDVAPHGPEASALITFTSGSTGRAKGADRTHGHLWAQHQVLCEHAPLQEGEVIMTCFPAVTLHDLACGVTTVLPPVDLRAPATIDPQRALECMLRYRVTFLSTSPAFLRRVCEHMVRTGARVPGVRRVEVGGAPVSRRVCALVQQAFPQAENWVIYGSTEAEPMTRVAMTEAIAGAGAGFLVGRPVAGAEIALVTLPDPPPAPGAPSIDPWRVAPGQVGEVIVRGPHVNRRYVDNPQADRANKILVADGTVWHRTGDLARLDAQDRLWLVGRAADRIKGALDPYPLESAALDVPGVRTAALLAHAAAPTGELCVELEPDTAAEATLQSLRTLLASGGHDAIGLRAVAEIPMDPRHQSRVDRSLLRTQLETASR